MVIIGGWKVFEKAGKSRWAAIVPIYNIIVGLEIVDKPWWWIFLLMIPFVNIYFGIMVAIDLADRFGRGGGFAAGLFLLPWIFVPILGFGEACYRGPGGAGVRQRYEDEEEEDEPAPRRRRDEDEDEDEPRPRRRPQ